VIDRVLTPERITELRELVSAWEGVTAPTQMPVRDMLDLCETVARLRAERDLLRAENRLSRLLDNDGHETQMEHDENVIALEAARAAVDAFDKEAT